MDGRYGRALGRARLQEPQLARLDRKFDVLHIALCSLQLLRMSDQLRVSGRHAFGHGGQRQCVVASGNHVLALGLRQPLAKRLSRTSRWIACENYAGPGSLVEIAKHHCLHGYGCANTIVNAALRTVNRGTARVPGVKYGADRAFELPPGIGIRRMAYDIAVLLLEPPARIGCEHRRSRFASHGVFDFRRQSQVQYRIHHPRHAYWGAGAHRDQQRPRTASKFPPRDRFQMIHRGRQRGGYPVGQFAARREIAAAFIRTQHEGWWYCNAHTEHTLDAPGFPAK